MEPDQTKVESQAAVAERRALVPDHELIRQIGEGAYGEVWLARNVMGTYRAVKMVYRQNFSSDQPYEREFTGIRKYEPISRTNEGLVDILQVGRNDAEGYFYYVMELADGANERSNGVMESWSDGQAPVAQHSSTPTLRDSSSYSPRTLKSEIQQRGHLPPNECVQLSLSLSHALSHLHGHNLLHRDLKPSNLIFVDGVPKLADIGLVTDTTEARTFVGTEGFIPPEGPNSRQADIFSLGMVLYEISSGKQAKDFPEPSLELVKGKEREALLELNAVILKACAADPRQRYASAEAMGEELSLLQHGKSVVAKHTRQRLLAAAGRTAVVVALMALIVAGGFWIARQPVRIANVTPRQLHPDNAAFWRAPLLRQFDFSPGGDRIVFAGENGVFIWDEKTSINRPLKLRGFAGWQIPRVFGIPRWAPDGRHFIFQAFKTTGGTAEGPVNVGALFLVNPETGEFRQIGPEFPAGETVRDLCWLLDGNAVTYLSQDDRFYTLHLTGGRSLWLDSHLPGERPAIGLGAYSPDGKWLLISAGAGRASPTTERHIWLMPHSGGRAVPVVQRPGVNTHPTWGPDGDAVYFVSSGGQRFDERHPDLAGTWGLSKVRIDLKTGLPRGESQEVFVKKGLAILHPKFVANGRKLTYAVQEPATRVWVADAERLDQPEEIIGGQQAVPSPDGRTIYFVGETPEQRGVFAIDRNGKRGLRRVTALAPVGRGVMRRGIDLSPDGERIALFSHDGKRFGVFVVPAAGGEATLLEELTESEVILPVWSPDGQWLAYTADKVLYRVSRDGKAREALATLYRWHGWSLRWSPDGNHIAAFAYASPEEWEDKTGVFVVDVASKNCKKVSPDTEDKYKEGLEWHPDGQRLTYFFYGPEEKSAKIKRAYLDGRPTEEMIDQPDHWDYVGVWAPDGRRYFFSSSDCKGPKSDLHIYDAQTKEITHGVRSGSLPVWSQDEKTVVWTTRNPLRYFEVLENFR